MNTEGSSGSTQESNARERRDLASGLSLWLIWILPIVFLSFTGTAKSPYLDRVLSPYLVLIWPVLLAFMGGACLYNARGSRRLHCYITGPFFFLLGAVALLYGRGWLPLGSEGWRWLAYVLVAGSIVLTCAPELFFGKYTRGST